MAEATLIQCKSCGAMNRVAEKNASGKIAVCGRCKSPLDGAASPAVVTDANFSSLVEQSSLPVLLDMWAPWCGPCRMVGPVVDELARELAGRVRVGKMNVDENPQTSDRFQVRSIPALLILRHGRELDRIVGAVPKAEMLRRLERAIG